MKQNVLTLFYAGINSIEMSVRLANFFAAHGIQTLGDLVQLAEVDVLKWTYIPEDSDKKIQFGKKDLSELQSILKARDLKLEMVIDAEIRAAVDSEIKKLEGECAQLQTQRQELQARWNELKAKNKPPFVPDPLMEKFFGAAMKNADAKMDKLAQALLNTKLPSTDMEIKNCLPELQSRLESLKQKITDLTAKIQREKTP